MGLLTCPNRICFDGLPSLLSDISVNTIKRQSSHNFGHATGASRYQSAEQT